MMPLCFADIETPYIIKKIGGNHDVKIHLENLGFHIGGEVSVLSVIDNNLVVRVKDTRIALSSELARRIMV